MKTLSRITLAAFLLATVAVGGTPAADEDPQYEGIPSYSVTRLKIFEGSVWVRTPDSGEWEEFFHNSPIPERARVSVPEESEAELQFHGGQFMLLTGGTEVDLRRLGDDITVFRIRSGEIRFDLPAEDFSPVKVLVPNDARVDLLVPGKYWLIAPEGEDPRLVVRAGEAAAATDRGESTVRQGEEARIGTDILVGPYAGGPGEEPREEVFLSDEERQAGVPPAAVSELRQYGEWVYSAEYGYVWRPRVAPGWSPYYYGRWVWISPYGWTWVSYEPWGWYPYHYGYWYTDPIFGWVWYPFHSFVSVGFVFGHHHVSHFHRRVHFFPCTVRIVRDGRSVRWIPLRPGDRFRRVGFTRADKRLARWERPLREGTVFVRREGDKGREWRDWTAVRGERRVAREPRTRILRNGAEDRTRKGDIRREVERRGNTRREDTRSNEVPRGNVRPGRERKDVREWKRENIREKAVGERSGGSVDRDVPRERERVRDRTDRPGRLERYDSGRGRIERDTPPPPRMEKPMNRRMERTREPRARTGTGERGTLRQYRAEGTSRGGNRELPATTVRPDRASVPARSGSSSPPPVRVRGMGRTDAPRGWGEIPRGGYQGGGMRRGR